ncbi:MAG TPA: Hsp20/alpha crystallin family protein [Erysipelotrichaceae bacterium]|nr:Hsp20/alpha crystallin family protein [Erysipelotrichaceae bacterium]
MLLPSIFRDDLFDDDFMDFPPMRGFSKENTLMKTDAKETENGYQLSMDLPGFKKEDVKMQLKEGVLNIEATTSTSNDEKDDEGKYIRRERFQGTCQRSFFVGKDVKQEDIKAKFEDGVLHLEVPKKEETKQIPEKHTITIE